jgi:hypothetical protein
MRKYTTSQGWLIAVRATSKIDEDGTGKLSAVEKASEYGKRAAVNKQTRILKRLSGEVADKIRLSVATYIFICTPSLHWKRL